MRSPSPAAAAHPFTADPPSASAATGGSRQLKRRVLWTGGTTLLIALLALTPPLVNANRYRTKIAESMSKSLGRPVHLDNVSMHLLPVPGFTLQNLVVSEDPDFGAEPTIRANTVEATLRVSSLWHRPVEFSTVRFVEPSVNLVRIADGRWNVSEVLMHASRVESAPTTQGHAGPEPRFPYIEATGGRVNIKLGIEKLPFSLTDTDFALWLPSARQWRVRMLGHPARTDTDITDPGTVRVEGEFQRAANPMAVPVNFRGSWHNAPLGEATRIVAGTDLGWRGSLNVDATLKGTLGDALLVSKTTLGGLRRAEFFPAHPLDLQITCGSAFSLHPATLTNLRCNLPDDGPEPLSLSAQTVHLQGVASTPATLTGEAIPIHWALLWAGLFSPRFPAKEPPPGGTLDLNMHYAPREKTIPSATNTDETIQASEGGWSGAVRLSLPKPDAPEAGDPDVTNALLWQVTNPATGSDRPSFHLSPTVVAIGPASSLTVGGEVGEAGYSLDVVGNASAATLSAPARYLPQLGDGLSPVLLNRPDVQEPFHVQFFCARSWTAPQTCSQTAPAAAPVERTPAKRRKRLTLHGAKFTAGTR